MNIELLNAFVTLAKYQNYRETADALAITQSALTKKIYRLESDVGATLFDRNRTGTKLSIVGECLLPEAKRVLESSKQFNQLSEQVATGRTGYLNIGFGISTIGIAPSHIATFKQSVDDVHITLSDLPSHTQIERLLSGDLHLAYTRLPVPPQLSAVLIKEETLCIAIHKEHLGKSPDAIVSSLPYLALHPDKGQGFQRQIDKAAPDLKWQPKASQYADDLLNLLSLVRANMGFTVVPLSARSLGDENTLFLPLEGQYCHWQVGLVWNSAIENPARERYLAMLQKSIPSAKQHQD
jgi:DNA-binding transcriptional LysR family regulator